MSTVKVSTTFGQITLKLRPDAAPKTVEHFCKLAPLFDGCCFYRSDFVIQGGLQRADGSSVQNPMKPIPVNETHTDVVLSNVRGTAAFGHWDVPDAGNSDWFINLKDNAHLDSAYGGYAVFAAVDPGDAALGDDPFDRAHIMKEKPTISCVPRGNAYAVKCSNFMLAACKTLGSRPGACGALSHECKNEDVNVCVD